MSRMMFSNSRGLRVPLKSLIAFPDPILALKDDFSKGAYLNSRDSMDQKIGSLVMFVHRFSERFSSEYLDIQGNVKKKPICSCCLLSQSQLWALIRTFLKHMKVSRWFCRAAQQRRVTITNYRCFFTKEEQTSVGNPSRPFEPVLHPSRLYATRALSEDIIPPVLY